jgi:AraC-like DNA-binding protein
MNYAPKIQSMTVRQEQSLFTLVENRSAFTMERCELNVFETHQKAERVNLVFGDMVLTSMLRGKKVMHLRDKPSFDYLPGQSVIVAPNEVMRIDFPEARMDNPTQCIALAIAKEQIQETVNLLNENFAKVEAKDSWHIDEKLFHLENSQELADIINRLIRISIKEHAKEKDILAKLALQELLVRLMQTQARELFEKNYLQMASSHRFAHVIQYIKENLREKIDLDALPDKACMSRANFFRKFKETFGYSPGDYIQKERIVQAKEFLKNPFISISEVCFLTGFQNLHHFVRVFKKETGATPKAYQYAGKA